MKNSKPDQCWLGDRVKRENYLKEDERILINNFIKKIKDELNSVN